jgi:hypothetical protein
MWVGGDGKLLGSRSFVRVMVLSLNRIALGAIPEADSPHGGI